MTRRHGRSRGFVLVAVLILLVVLTLLAGTVALVAERAVSEAQEDVAAFEGELDVLGTRDTLLFLLATQRTTLAGLTVDEQGSMPAIPVDDDVDGLAVMPVGNEIGLDGSVYAGVGRSRFLLQDGRGLINPNFAPPAVRIALFEAMGVRFEDQATMEARRLDYQDPDSLLRIGGAEADEYKAAGLPPPANRAVATPLEFRRILGWQEMLRPFDDDQLLRMLSADRNFVLNVNSAPAEVLALFPGVDTDTARRVVALRRTTPFTSMAQVRQIVPLAGDDGESMTLFAGTSGDLVAWDSRGGPRRLFHWTLTPYDDGGRPWRIDYEVTLPRGNTPDPDVVAAPAAPVFSTEDPARG